MSLGPSRVLVVIPNVPGSPDAASLLCDEVTAQLKDSQFPAYPVHRMQPRTVREQVIRRVRKMSSWIMVTTQEGGHKLNLDGLKLEHVVFYGWPKPEQLDPRSEFLVLFRRLNTIQDWYKSFTILHYYFDERQYLSLKDVGNCLVQAQRLMEMLQLLHQRGSTRP